MQQNSLAALTSSRQYLARETKKVREPEQWYTDEPCHPHPRPRGGRRHAGRCWDRAAPARDGANDGAVAQQGVGERGRPQAHGRSAVVGQGAEHGVHVVPVASGAEAAGGTAIQVVGLQSCTSTPFRIKWGIQCLVVPAQTEVCREYSSRGR